MWTGDGPKKTFEFQTHSLFCLPRHCWHQLSNARGDRPVRILNYNYLPVAMATFPEPHLLFNNPYENPGSLYGKDGEEFYAEAKMVTSEGAGRRGQGVFWRANFIPDMSAWDKLIPSFLPTGSDKAIMGGLTIPSGRGACFEPLPPPASAGTRPAIPSNSL